MNVIHVTGKNKMDHVITHPRYQAYELLTDAMAEALHQADVVVCRAGFGTIPNWLPWVASVIIPIPRSHQEDNAQWVAKQAAVVLSQDHLTSEKLLEEIKTLSHKEVFQQNMSQLLPTNATHAMSDHHSPRQFQSLKQLQSYERQRTQGGPELFVRSMQQVVERSGTPSGGIG